MSPFKEWYQKNRDELARRRKERYHSDPVYRAQVKARSEDYRKRVRDAKPEFPGMTIAQVCEHLGVSDWTLNKWRNLGYYPEPIKYNGKPSFTQRQVALLASIKRFFKRYPRRSAALHRAELEQLTADVAHKWQS